MMLVNICSALSYALMKPWIPQLAPTEVQEPAPPSPAGDKSPAGKKGRAVPAPQKSSKPAAVTVTISSEAMPDLKRAIEVS